MKKRIISIIFILGLIVLPFCRELWAEDAEIKASIGSDKIGLDDTLNFTITVKGIPITTQPDLSHVTDFRVTGSSHSERYSIINGVMSRSVDFTFFLTPTKLGTLNIPPVSYTYNGKEYKTQSFKVEVVKGSVASPNSRQQGNPVSPFDVDEDFFSSPFMRRSQQQQEQVDVKVVTEISKRKAIKGEQLIARVLLYSRNRVRNVSMVSNASFPGFWQEWYPTDQTIEGKTQNVDGKLYQVYEIRKAGLFPTQTGPVTIPALQFDIVVISGGFFPEARTVSRSTNPVSVSVSELPNQASGLPVGRFTFDVSTDKKQIDINDILSVKVKITGNGNVKGISAPIFQAGDLFKVYPPKVSNNMGYQENGVTGTLVSEIPVAFNKPGNITFPALEFSFFDPTKSSIVSLRSAPFTISVTGVKENQGSASTVMSSDIIKEGEDIDFIKKGNIYDQEKNFSSGGLFILLVLLPFIVVLGIAFKKYVFDKYIIESDLFKKHKLLNTTIKRLKSINDFGEVSPILEFYLNKKTGIGLAEINNQNIDQLLEKSGVGNDDIKSFIRIKSQSDSSRFSPDKSLTGASNETVIEEVTRVIDILKRIDGKIK